MRLNMIQLFTNSAVMMSNLFIPILAHEFEASGIEIGIIGAAYGGALFISTYIFSRAADLFPPKTLLYAGFLSASVTFFLQIFAYDPLSLGVVRALAGFSAGVYPAVLVLYVYNLKRSIGKFSSFMPLGWAVGNLLAGIIAVYWQIFAIASLLFASSFLVTLTLPGTEVHTRKKADYFSRDILKKNWGIYFSFFLRQIGANNVWVIFPLYLASLGADKLWIGIIYMLNPALQFLIMRRLDRYNTVRLIHAGDLISAVAFISLIPLTIYYQAIFGMVLIAFSYSCLYVGSVRLLIDTNEEKGTASGLLNSAIAFSTIIGSLLGGAILEYYGFQGVMAIGAFFAVLGYAVIRFKSSGISQRSY
ncbi:MAG: MFS transporter [Candidatus Methanoperedens sp.]|nr:MFS transporter [Candidatus Methanoperedens nitroreducens]MDJ1421116.1 MFS transporter [Candidatus Methanoperedens sp.]